MSRKRADRSLKPELPPTDEIYGQPEPVSRTCPVIRRARKTARLSNDLVREMKRLRTDLRRCRRCPLNLEGHGCPVLEMVNTAIQQAIMDVNEEWGMHA